MLEILFTDNGPGIPPEERAKIFNKFYQIEGSFTGQVQGMGLGLALVKRVVDEHGGHVRLESELGKGSTFIVSLPLQ
jgi:signal transduction histidine kinase